MDTLISALVSSDMASALQILVLGWGGIFVVMIVIYLVSLALARLFPPHKEA